MSNTPVITFFARTWQIFTFMVLSNFAVLSNAQFGGHTLFEMLGAVLYVPAVASVVLWTALLVVHLFFRQTLDQDAHDGTYVRDWRALTPAQRAYIGTIIRIGILIGFCILCASMARGGIPDQAARWQSATINPHYSIALDIDAALFKRNVGRYQQIASMRANGVPANVLFTLHQRESSGSFLCHPHEGSPLTHRTRYVPKNRPPPPAQPPFSFDQSAEDAYYVIDRLDLIVWSQVDKALQGIESFNGLGYQRFHPEVPSPYLWNGLLLNGKATRGKYTGDGNFDRNAVDKQLGCAAILLRLKEKGVALPWEVR